MFYVFALVLALGSGVGTAPDLGNHFLLRQKVIKNRFSIPTVKLTSRCALRSDSHRESEFLWGSALRFARAFFASFWVHSGSFARCLVWGGLGFQSSAEGLPPLGVGSAV